MIRTALALGLAAASLSVLPPSSAAPTPDPVDLRTAARVNDMTVGELREVLADPTMHLDGGGRLVVADVLHDTAVEPVAEPHAVAPLADTFRLHSLPLQIPPPAGFGECRGAPRHLPVRTSPYPWIQTKGAR